jgi:hypothetical protein
VELVTVEIGSFLERELVQFIDQTRQIAPLGRSIATIWVLRCRLPPWRLLAIWNMEPPKPKHRQRLVLFEMGELKGVELERCTGWFRAYYDDANQMADRTEYWRWGDIPASLVKKWDAERGK